MPIESPLHPRTSALCRSLRWKDWSGYFAVCSYDSYMEREYFALRHGAGLMDVTPLYKYEVRGQDAERLLSYVTVRDVSKLKHEQVTYACWCDERGKLMDDGTIWHIDEQWYRVTAAEPTLFWLRQHARAGGFEVEITDITETVAAMSLQGPNARAILKQVTDIDMDALRFFRLQRGTLDGREVIITRTGYTGDLGYEIWCENDDAIAVWDAIADAGADYGLEPMGLDALDVARVEAGFIMNGVDYFSANHCLTEARTSTPDEAGLGWTVKMDRPPNPPNMGFIGMEAIAAERARGSTWDFVGLDIDWEAFEQLHALYNLPPEICSHAWRDAKPVYDKAGRHIGQATSGAWSPTLKKNLALATLLTKHTNPGTIVHIETTVEYARHTIPAIVTKLPFFNPERKRS